MALNDGSNFCIRLFCVVLVVAVLAQSSAVLAQSPAAPDKPPCIDRIRGIMSRPEGPTLLGGWRPVEDPENDPIVKGIVAAGVKHYNLASNDMFTYNLFAKGNVEAYSQLVNGQNYCVEFVVASAGCKNSMRSDYSPCRTSKVKCSVSAYKAFRDEAAKINPESLKCSPVV